MRRLLYLIGQPGAGKSTAVRQLCEQLQPVVTRKPLLHTSWYAPGEPWPLAWSYGSYEYEAAFPGTDRLGLGAQPRAVQLLDAAPASLCIAEGDRLANRGFFDSARKLDYTVTVVWLATPDELCDERRAARDNAPATSWVAGRRTKHHRLGTELADLQLVGEGNVAQQLLHLLPWLQEALT